MNEDVTILLSEEEIAARVAQVAQEIDEYYRAAGVTEVLAVCILKGSLVFTADLVRKLQTKIKIDFLQVKSYNGAMTTGRVEFLKDLGTDICGKHVLIIEDIIDTGNTLTRVIEKLWEREPAGIRLCSFLDKPARRTVKLKGDFICFTIPDHFAVGYGLDYEESYRNLPYVGILKPEVYQKEA